MIEKMTRKQKYDEDKYPGFPDDIYNVEMEEGVIDKKDDSKNIYDERKEAEFPDDTPTDEIEQSIGVINDDKNEDIYVGKEA